MSPRIEDAVAARDFRPEAVLGRVPGRAVEGLEVPGLVLTTEDVYPGRWLELVADLLFLRPLGAEELSEFSPWPLPRKYTEEA